MAISLIGVGTGSFKVTVAGVDLTADTKSVTINQTYDDVDITAMAATSKAHLPGLRDDSIDIEFFQDRAANKVDATLNGIIGVAAGATVVIIDGGTAASSTTPSYTLVGIPFTYSPVDGAVGAVSMTKVTFKPAAGQSIVRATV